MTKNKKGFTIIEVVLVLAIAGLIFLMVFIALPALQRSQRNTRRRQDMARILSAFNDYQANNNGKMPGNSTEAAAFMNKYVGDSNSEQRQDPDGNSYTIKYVNVSLIVQEDETEHLFNSGISGVTTPNHTVYYFPKAKCGTIETNVAKATGDREIAIFYILEGGSIYCGDNQ